jgi:hypothetical protein
MANGMGGVSMGTKLTRKEYDRAYHEKNRDRILEKQKEYRETHKDCEKKRGQKYRLAHREELKAYQKSWKERNPDKIFKYRLETSAKIKVREAGWKYQGIDCTYKLYEKLLSKQDYRCANFTCRKHHLELRRGLAVDHDHKTGKVRGLLCDNCNNGLGKLGDNIESLKAMVIYLETCP